ncbi:L-threonine 3-dehydrogenase [Lentilactobacillus hilgardii]|uniref:quinone oxidoreductase family protein n=1 Tax=Lentilactobacillus hilgardii TaxID=1588 RepID=UPI00019C5B29|nr:zinc-binding alcohol dehydrogenase family protein [Lentilactobacillus hilgardii]EEI18567.1 GroES-like protein [Lentilactobacillus buchneri ATCC 11577]QIR09487.1 L-threonine 3-dehydrogenase [Lentilactobacillus hilgardii]
MMKAAVLTNYGNVPEYQDFAEPKVMNDHQLMVSPKASSIKQLDISKAAGKHYTNFDPLPAVMGMDGVAELDDGTRIYAMGLTGMMAERAIIDKQNFIKLPNGLDSVKAAALPNALMGSDLALIEKGKIKQGDVVFVNGATGATGMMAVQLAKFHGASKIIATGRNSKILDHLKTIGADKTILINEPDEQIVKNVVSTYSEAPFDIVIDYLWGHPAEVIFDAFRKIKLAKHLKYITVGGMAGSDIQLSSQIFRSKDIELIGSGIGSFSSNVFQNYLRNNLPLVFDYAASGHLDMNLNVFPLSQISTAWVAHGRSVVTI